jgi:hypothetical protein
MVEQQSHKLHVPGSTPGITTRVAHPTTPVERLCRSEAPLAAESTGEKTGHYVCVTEWLKVPDCKPGGTVLRRFESYRMHCWQTTTQGVILIRNLLVFILAVLAISVVVGVDDAGAAQQPPKGWNWVCNTVQKDYVDPIAKRGVYPTPHKHVILGSTLTPYTTALQLSKQPNNCRWANNVKDEGDKSVPWMPPPVFRDTGREVDINQVNVYYRIGKGIKPSEVRPPVFGWRYILGNAEATGAQPHIKWRCANTTTTSADHPIDCTQYGEKLKVSFFFPSCLDGRKDSPNHQDHAVFPGKNGCPASHPRAIPAINLSFGIRTMDGTNIEFKESDGHTIAPHADYFNGTPRDVWRKWIDKCITSDVGGCAGTGIPGQKNPE